MGEVEMLEEQVAGYMQKYHMTEPESRVLVGVSGGADSVCLLVVLALLREALKIDLVAVHVHHGIRGDEADQDAAYAERLCGEMDVPCRIFHADVPGLAMEWHMSLEEAARKVRYEAFRKIAKETGAGGIAVAHHREDQEETILMHLFRGSGLRGVAGMEPVAGDIIRPLLECSREDIEAFLKSRNIVWQMDSTNLSQDYTRNYVRQSLLPEINGRFPQAGKHLRNLGAIARETEGYLVRQGAALFAQYGVLTEGGCRIASAGFASADPVIRPYLLRYAMEQAGMPLKDVTARHLTLFQELFAKEVGKRMHLPSGYEAVKEYEGVFLTVRENGSGEKRMSGDSLGDAVSGEQEVLQEELDVQNQPMPVRNTFPRMEKRIFSYDKNMKISENPYAKWFDYDKITEAVTLRTRQTGDRFSPLPQGSKKLKDYMIDAKIPREQRDTVPLVAMGSTILWIVGYRMSEAYKVTPETKRILQIAIVW